MRRSIVIQDKKLKKQLLEKEKLTGEKNEVIEEFNKYRDEVTKKLNKIKEKINKISEKIIDSAKKIDVDLKEFEELQSIRVEEGEIVLTVVDKVEEFKKDYLKLKKELAEDSKPR